MLVRLSSEDVHNCTLMGYDTVALCKRQGFPPRLENKNQTREEANALGFKAEFAVARLLGTNLPTVNVVTDGGVDLWFDDVSIDVKFTNNAKNGLIFDNPEKFKARVAVLVAPTDEPDVMSIEGWIGRPEFIRIATTKNFGYGSRLVVQSYSLLGIETLWKKLHELRFEKKPMFHKEHFTRLSIVGDAQDDAVGITI